MTIKLKDITKWVKLPMGQILALAHDAPRKVALEVNCAAETRIDVVHGESITFLAVVHGYAAIEFGVPGPVELVFTSEDDVFYATDDGGMIGFEYPEESSFTTIMNRRSRNPELERMMWKLESRMYARIASQEEELARLRGEVRTVNSETGEVDDGEDDTDGGTGTGGGTPPSGTGDEAAAPAKGKAPDAGTGTGVPA